MEVLGIILAIIFGIPAYFFLFQKKKTKLFFIKDKQINLQDDLLKNFDNLSIKYNDVEINDEITFVKGHIMCVGDKDINGRSNKIEIFADNILWLDFKITNTSRDLDVKSTIINDKVLIEFGLLKSGESFEFEGIINNNNSLNQNEEKNIKLNFFHRIPNLLKIEEIDPLKIKFKKEMLIFGLIFLFLGGFLCSLANTIEPYDIEAYDAKTKKIISNSLFSNEESLRKVKDDYLGFELFFKQTKSYKMQYYFVKDKKRKMHDVWVYYRKPKDLSFAAFICSIVIIILGILLSTVGLWKLSQRRYFKKVKTIYN